MSAGPPDVRTAGDLELAIAGMVIVAASELRFMDFVRLWDSDLARTWEREAHLRGWTFCQHGWGDFSRREDDAS